jgi:hypothetical protein
MSCTHAVHNQQKVPQKAGHIWRRFGPFSIITLLLVVVLIALPLNDEISASMRRILEVYSEEPEDSGASSFTKADSGEAEILAGFNRVNGTKSKDKANFPSQGGQDKWLISELFKDKLHPGTGFFMVGTLTHT